MPKFPRFLPVAAVALAVAGCASQRVYEEAPHHFSQDAKGNRVACFATETASEYDCVPVTRRYDHARPYYYDPFWSHRFLYAWPYPYSHVIVVRDPPRRPQPPPHIRPRKN